MGKQYRHTATALDSPAMELHVDRDSGVPVSTQLAWRIRSAIERGELAAGDRLPSLRDAALAAGVNVNTVRAVYAKLEAAGAVATEQGRGTFVAAAVDTTAADGADSEAARRRRLRDDIARLEAELVNLPALLSSEVGAPAHGGRGGPRLLSIDELAGVRDLLAERVAELRDARAQIVERLEAGDDAEPETAPADRTAPRAPARRSSSSLAGARIRWTGA